MAKTSGGPRFCLEERPTNKSILFMGRYINLQRVAEATRLDHGYLSYIFQGKRTPSVDVFELIAGAMGMTMDGLRLGIRERKSELERKQAHAAS